MKNNNKKTLVSAVQAALIKAGQMPVPQVSVEDSAAEAEVTVDVTVDNPAVVAEAETPEVVAADDKPKVTAAAPETVTAEEVDSRISLLKEQLSEKDEHLFNARSELKAAQAQLESLNASVDGIKKIAVQSINAMQVALNKAVVDYEDADASEVVSAHAKLSADFEKNFPVGGVAAVTPSTEVDEPSHDHQWAAKLAAV